MRRGSFQCSPNPRQRPTTGRPGGRLGVGPLRHAGLGQLLAEDPREYVRIAADLVSDEGRLIELRKSLRARLEASPLMNHERFARMMETAYRVMWTRWCNGQPPSPFDVGAKQIAGA